MLFKRKASAVKAAEAVPTPKPARPAKAPPTAQAAPGPDGELDVRALGRTLWRRKRAIVIPTLIVTALTAAAVHVITPQYKSSASILYDGRENIFLRPAAENATAEPGPADDAALTSQVQLVLSRELALDVIRKFKLNELPEFDPVLMGIPPWKVALAAAGLVRDPLRMTSEERTLEAFSSRLTAFPLERSRVINIEFLSSDPKLAARITNEVADDYVRIEQSVKQQQTRGAGEWLQEQIEKLRQRVGEAEARAEKFRNNTNLLVGTNNTTLSNQQLGELNSQLGVARAQKTDAETRARLIRDMLKRGGPIEASDVTNSELIRRLSEQRVTLRAQLAEQSTTLLDQHPRIKELKAQIADLDQQIKIEAEKLIRSLENDARIADARVEALSANLDQLKRQAAVTNEQDVQLRALDREARAQRDLLESYLAKYREATARDTIGSAPPDTRIISRAVVSNTPYFPKKLPTILVAMLAMLVISAGFVTTGELMRHSSAPASPGSAWIPAEARLSVAVTDPVQGDPGQDDPAQGLPLRAIDDLARELRTAGEGGRRLAVFGVSRQAGTSLSAVGLARALARDARVVLVDLALGSPRLAAISTDPHAPGVAEIARGACAFGDAITRDKLSRVHLVGAGRPGPEGAAVVASERLTMMIEALGRAYDHVIIDAGAAHEAAVERFYRLARRAALVATDPAAPMTRAAHERLVMAGFGEVVLLEGAPAATAAAAA